MKKPIILAVHIALAVILWLINVTYSDPYSEKAFITIVGLTAIYLIFRIVLEGRIAGRLKDPKASYSFRKIISVLYVLAFVSILTIVWIPEPQTLIVSLGILGAGVAIALQDVFKNFVASAVVFMTGLYSVGDRIEINGRYGDVVDIGLQYTTLIEIREWVEGDQATGRLSSVPNGHILSNAVNNYTRDYGFIWDEIEIPVTYDSDWKAATEKILTIAVRETASDTRDAEEEMERLSKKYFFEKRMAAPGVFLRFTDNWVSLRLRYVTNARLRRPAQSRISRLILEDLEKCDNIRIASQTTAIVEIPELRIGGDAFAGNRKT